MHELSVARSVLEILDREIAARRGSRPLRAGLRLGAWCGVNPDALSFCLDALTREGPLAGLAFVLEVVPRSERCRSCGGTFEVLDVAVACPVCGALDVEGSGGDELEIAYLDVEEP